MSGDALKNLSSWLRKAGPGKPKVTDSTHMEPVKKSEPLEALEDWLAKAQIGVHMPSGKNSGNSPAGQSTRSHASAGQTTGRKPKDKAIAVAEHTRVLGEMRSMKKPNLPKADYDSDDDAPKKKKKKSPLDKGDEAFPIASESAPISGTNMKPSMPMLKALDALASWNAKAKA